MAFKLTRQQAVALSFTYLAEHAAREHLAAGDMAGHDIWSSMRDDKLRALFGMGLNEIHAFGHGKQEAA